MPMAIIKRRSHEVERFCKIMAFKKQWQETTANHHVQPSLAKS
jgi:hypothetical protein